MNQSCTADRFRTVFARSRGCPPVRRSLGVGTFTPEMKWRSIAMPTSRDVTFFSTPLRSPYRSCFKVFRIAAREAWSRVPAAVPIPDSIPGPLQEILSCVWLCNRSIACEIPGAVRCDNQALLTPFSTRLRLATAMILSMLVPFSSIAEVIDYHQHLFSPEAGARSSPGPKGISASNLISLLNAAGISVLLCSRLAIAFLIQISHVFRMSTLM